MIAHLQLLFAGPLVVALSGATAPPNAQEAALPTVVEIRQAWTHRSKTMSSYLFHAELTEQVAVKGRPLSKDPFEIRRKGREVNLITVQKTIAIKKDGTKVRTAIQGKTVDTDNGEVSEQQRHTCFDGQIYKRLSRRADAPFGLGAFGRDGTIVWLTYKTAEFQPMSWWLDPLTLFNGMPDANIQLSETTFKLFDRECVNLRVLKDGRIRSSIITFKSRPYLPIEITSYGRNGKESSKCTFVYSLEAEGAGRLVSWDAVYSSERKYRGKIIELTYGNRFDADEFNLQFPVGTHISEYEGKSRKTWLQASPTEMKPMKERDYGKLPEGIGKPAA